MYFKQLLRISLMLSASVRLCSHVATIHGHIADIAVAQIHVTWITSP